MVAACRMLQLLVAGNCRLNYCIVDDCHLRLLLVVSNIIISVTDVQRTVTRISN